MTAKRLGFAAAIAVSLLGCSGSADQKLITRGEDQIKKALVDPDSAKFRNVRINRVSGRLGTKVTALCGELNAKNRMGGYNGFEPFYVILEHTAPDAARWGSDRSIAYEVGASDIGGRDRPFVGRIMPFFCDPQPHPLDDADLNQARP